MASYFNNRRSIANNVTYELPGNTMTGEKDPRVDTQANFIGQFYLNTTTGKLFVCVSVDYAPTSYGVWEWLPVGGSGSAEKLVGSWKINGGSWDVVNYTNDFALVAGTVCAVKLYKKNGQCLIGRCDLLSVSNGNAGFGCGSTGSEYGSMVVINLANGGLTVGVLFGANTFDDGDYLQLVELA